MHVWRIALDLPPETLHHLRATLAPDELARAQRLRFAQHRDRFVAGRGILRAVLACYLRTTPDQLAFEYGPHGKPGLCDATGDAPYFNLSHSDDRALLVVARAEVGIDLEAVRSTLDIDSLAATIFSPAERRALLALPPFRRTAAFFAGWTSKEAYSKALGHGLSRDPRTFSVSLDPAAPALLAVEGQPDEPRHWTLHALASGPGYQAALAVAIARPHILCREWPPHRTNDSPPS